MDSNPSAQDYADLKEGYDDLLRQLNAATEGDAPNVDGWPPRAIATYFAEKLGTILQQMGWVNHDRSGVKSRDFSLAFTHTEDAFLRLHRLADALRVREGVKDVFPLDHYVAPFDRSVKESG
jgi:hypothetical protein